MTAALLALTACSTRRSSEAPAPLPSYQHGLAQADVPPPAEPDHRDDLAQADVPPPAEPDYWDDVAQAGVPPPAKPDYWDDAIDFMSNLPLTPNVTGELSGEIAFIQNTLVGPNRGEKDRPLLVTDRGAYLLFVPVDPEQQSVRVAIHSRDDRRQVLDLVPPENGAHSGFNNMDGRRAVVYSKRAWTTVVPWEFMHPGISISLRNAAGQTGTLAADAFEFGAPLELVIQDVKLGMLARPPRSPFRYGPPPGKGMPHELLMDYFQHVPVAKLIAAQYLPIHFRRVVLSSGKVYKHRSIDQSANSGKGDMLEDVGEALVRTGIALANVGVSSTAGGNRECPRPYRQTTVLRSVGLYTRFNKHRGWWEDRGVGHGLRDYAGDGFALLCGLDHGLRRPRDGKELFRHARDGGWGYHMFKHRLIANVSWNRKAPRGDFPYWYGWDVVMGTTAQSPVSAFPLHAPHALRVIQDTITSQSGILDADSATGYSRWDHAKQCMTQSEVDTPKPDQTGVSVMTLVGFYDPEPPHKLTSFIYPALYGNWGNVFLPQTIRRHYPDLAESRCVLEVLDADGNMLTFPLTQSRLSTDRMNQFHVNLAASGTYVQAKLCLDTGDDTIVLNARQIEPPHGTLTEPVVVGREHRFTQAVLQLRDMRSVLVPNGYRDRAELEQAMANYYGRIFAYAASLRVPAGGVCRHGDDYYQALTDSPATVPGDNASAWRHLGNASAYISTKRLALGEQSIDYARVPGGDGTGIRYSVPVDHARVVASDAGSPAVYDRHPKRPYSSLIVSGVAADGSKAEVVLRGQVNDKSTLECFEIRYDTSRVRFAYHGEDNPDLPPGTYAISFPAYVRGWNTHRVIEMFEVHGTVHVP